MSAPGVSFGLASPPCCPRGACLGVMPKRGLSESVIFFQMIGERQRRAFEEQRLRKNVRGALIILYCEAVLLLVTVSAAYLVSTSLPSNSPAIGVVVFLFSASLVGMAAVLTAFFLASRRLLQ